MTEKTMPMSQENQTPVQQEKTREENRYIAPPVDIYEEENKLTVIADLPGATQENVKIDVENNILTIEANTGYSMKGEPLYHEFKEINFFRQFELSNEVDVEKISAEYKNGVLTLDLPKIEKAQPKRIAVKTA